MSNPYVGEIRIFAGNFAPSGWAFCNGQLLPISENETLFVLIGTTYGGDGQETFALPDLQGRIPIHQGTGSGSTYIIGETGGVETVTLTVPQIPSHTHPLIATSSQATSANLSANVLAAPTSADLYRVGAPASPMEPSSLAAVGGSQPHDNMMPSLCVNFIISLFGIFPTQ